MEELLLLFHGRIRCNRNSNTEIFFRFCFLMPAPSLYVVLVRWSTSSNSISFMHSQLFFLLSFLHLSVHITRIYAYAKKKKGIPVRVPPEYTALLSLSLYVYEA